MPDRERHWSHFFLSIVALEGTTLELVDTNEVPRHHCLVVLQWRTSSLGVELRPATAEARLVRLAILRTFAAL